MLCHGTSDERAGRYDLKVAVEVPNTRFAFSSGRLNPVHNGSQLECALDNSHAVPCSAILLSKDGFQKINGLINRRLRSTGVGVIAWWGLTGRRRFPGLSFAGWRLAEKEVERRGGVRLLLDRLLLFNRLLRGRLGLGGLLLCRLLL